MLRRSLLLLLAAAGGCARIPTATPGAPTLRNDGIDYAYLVVRRREDGCHGEAFEQCCARVQERLEQALAAGAMEEAAVQLDLQALGCRRPRPENVARFRARELPHQVPTAASGPRVALSFRLNVDATDRIYWAGGFVDGRQPVSDLLTPGPHTLDVEVHLIPVAGIGADELFRIRRRIAITVPPDQPVRVVASIERLKEATPERAFEMKVIEQKPSAPGPGRPEPSSPPKVTKGRLHVGGTINPPTELYDSDGWLVMAKVCVDRTGGTSSVEPAVRMHPRDVGALIDWIVRQRHDPYQIDGVPVPYCYPLRFQVFRPS